MVNGVLDVATPGPKHRKPIGRQPVNYYAGIDVSLESSSVCIVDATGEIVKEAKVESHPDALVKFFKAFGLPLTVIGLEAGPLSQWLYAGLTEAGFVTTLMETRHVKAALSAMTVKTDRRDARGIAQLLRMGWFRPVHAKSAGSQEVRALLVARKLLQHKLRDIELSLRGILRGFGLKVGKVTDKTFEARIREPKQIGADLLADAGRLQGPAIYESARKIADCVNRNVADVQCVPDATKFPAEGT